MSGLTAGARRRPLRVGHKGADHIAPGNTAASFDAALEHGVDMIEFDVLPEHPPLGGRPPAGELYLAHDYEALRAPGARPLTLDQGLAHLAAEAFAEVGLDLDLKLPGYELRVLDALRAHGLVERTLVSTTYPQSLTVLRAAEPALRLGWSVPRARRDPFDYPLLRIPATALALTYRALLPRRAARALRAGTCDALMAHWRLVTPRLVRTVHAAGGELYVWTVDRPRTIARLERLGVDGVITNDPRLFT